MFNLLFKAVISGCLVAAISALSNRYVWLSAVLASIPLVSVLSLLWMYGEQQSSSQIANFCMSTFFMVIPSLILFVSLPILLKKGWAFYTALPLSLALMIMGYFVMLYFLHIVGWAELTKPNV